LASIASARVGSVAGRITVATTPLAPSVEALRRIDVVLRAAEDNGYDLALDAIEAVVDAALRRVGGQS
jgi:hypothetical protein